MPSTINGIGTHYYGKKNVATRHGTCEKCHRPTELASYDTGYYFVFLFVPILPLGRKRIVDYCPLCTAHRSISLSQWTQLSDEATREAMQEAERNPESPEAAINLLATLHTTQRHEDAQRMAALIAERFSDHADVQVGLALWHDENGREDEAHACFERALQLDPDNPGLKRAVAIGCIQRGDLARATGLLKFMEEPGPEQDAAVLVLLADAYQQQGDHAEAMRLYELAVSANPLVGQDRQLRQRIKATETQLGRQQTILPKKPSKRGRWIAAAAIAALLLVGFFLYNRSAANNQQLFVFNGLAHPVEVTIDGGDAKTIPAKGRVKLTLAEGNHQAVSQGKEGFEETIDFDIDNGLFQRMFDSPVFVLNIAGAETFLWEEIIYSELPVAADDAAYDVHFCEPFLIFRDVDYPFTKPPRRLSSERKRVTKTHVSVVREAPVDVMLGYFPASTPPAEYLRFAEHQLALNPNNERLHGTYLAIATGAEENDRCRTFLEAGLARRPVAVEWHRSYQALLEAEGEQQSLVQRYDRMLADDPTTRSCCICAGGSLPAARSPNRTSTGPIRRTRIRTRRRATCSFRGPTSRPLARCRPRPAG